MGERRRSVRHKSFLRGCVLFNKRRSTLDCLIRDMSSEGARITFADAVNVPDVLELHIPQKKQTVHARVQWRHGDEIGLVFPDAVRAADGTPEGELAVRVAQLETEIASLRRVLNRLKTEIGAGDDSDAA